MTKSKSIPRNRRKNPHHTAPNEKRSAIREIKGGLKMFRKSQVLTPRAFMFTRQGKI